MATESHGTPVLDLIMNMNVSSLAAADTAAHLDPDVLMLVRIAALVAVDAPPASYLVNLGAAAETGVEVEQVQGVLAAVAPIVGTPRVVSATGKIAAGLGLALEALEPAGE